VVDAIEHATVLLRSQAAPLLVMERDAVALALVTDGSNPVDLDAAKERPAFTDGCLKSLAVLEYPHRVVITQWQVLL
jgi:hypothetical protein